MIEEETLNDYKINSREDEIMVLVSMVALPPPCKRVGLMTVANVSHTSVFR